jgi:hypothetical protein
MAEVDGFPALDYKRAHLESYRGVSRKQKMVMQSDQLAHEAHAMLEIPAGKGIARLVGVVHRDNLVVGLLLGSCTADTMLDHADADDITMTKTLVLEALLQVCLCLHLCSCVYGAKSMHRQLQCKTKFIGMCKARSHRLPCLPHG